jgi:hypothetical protein
MTDQSSVGVYETMEQAEEAVRKLDLGSFPIKQVSIVAANLQTAKEVRGFISTGDFAKGGAGTGARVGGFFGLMMGGAFLFVPGFGPLMVIGSLAAVLLGAAEGAGIGAAGGGVLGALAGWGISKQHILKYEDHVKGGKYLVVAHGSAEEVARAQTILQGSTPTELNNHAESSQDTQTSGATEPAHAH